MREAETAGKAARKGRDVPEILAAYPRLFTDEIMSALHLGEETGRLAEVMKKQAEYFREEARRKMRTLAYIAGGGVYAAIALMLIVVIFQIVMSVYIGPINDAQNAVDNPEKWLRGE